MEKIHDELTQLEQEITDTLQTVHAIIEQAKANNTDIVQIEADVLEMLLTNYGVGARY
ncbi:hypothetical protein [Vibrio sp. AND4]|uniref:hypothetical protein n=1 Tax=Vibrio sp. AND4 TaxID=314289 RepID=UPI00015F2FBC|nr:hypothetical protein [Vibrio sp. AND4]EDP60835.1 hypothetical protein AND4_07944 [Vibrio sp. AND4]